MIFVILHGVVSILGIGFNFEFLFRATIGARFILTDGFKYNIHFNSIYLFFETLNLKEDFCNYIKYLL